MPMEMFLTIMVIFYGLWAIFGVKTRMVAWWLPLLLDAFFILNFFLTKDPSFLKTLGWPPMYLLIVLVNVPIWIFRRRSSVKTNAGVGEALRGADEPANPLLWLLGRKPKSGEPAAAKTP